MVAPNQILRVIARFEDYKGRFAYHCHILEHEDHEMMRQFQTVSCGDAAIDPTEACDDGAANGTLSSCCTISCDLVTAGLPCDDGDACTMADQCQAETCVPGTAVAPPGEVTALGFAADGITLSWDPIPGAPPGMLYDAARGVAGELPVGAGAGEICQASVTTTSIPDATVPGAGQIYWYLVRGRHMCGTGTYGTAWMNGAPGAERITGACP